MSLSSIDVTTLGHNRHRRSSPKVALLLDHMEFYHTKLVADHIISYIRLLKFDRRTQVNS